MNVDSLQRACDDLVAASPDPAAAMAAIVQAWALGAAGGDDLLDDLERIAITAALARGVELTAPELLEAFGEHDRAQRIRDAVDAGRRRVMEAAARAARIHAMTTARGAAA